MSGRYVVRTFGCKANLADSQLIEAELRRRGWSAPSAGDARDVDLCIINSCTVTDEADRQSRRLAARLARENPGAAVVFTGCAAEVDPERLARSKGIQYVVGNCDKPQLVETVLARVEARKAEKAKIAKEGNPAEILGAVRSYTEILSRHPHDREWPATDQGFTLPPIEADDPARRRTRAFLKIQEGCNAFCTYCIIPYGRGPSRSPRPRELLEQIQKLVAGGVREVVLTGTNIGDYGLDWGSGPALGDLVAMILGETALERLRLSSLDPTEITPQLFDLMAREQPRLCPHFHVSLQSPHDRVLKLMKRRYGSREVRGCLEAIASLPTRASGGIFVGMDVITGFPGEGEAEFEASLHSLEELPWTRLHVFPYSERAGTPATRLPGTVPVAERARRARVLGALSLARLRRFAANAIAEERLDGVLLEKPGPEWVNGHTPNYLNVFVRTVPGEMGNRIVSVRPQELRMDETSGNVTILGSGLITI